MNILDQIKSSAFNDELQKIAMSTELLKSYIGKAGTQIKTLADASKLGQREKGFHVASMKFVKKIFKGE